MRYGILGPVQAGSIALGGPRVRALLALLLVDAGRVVTAERLIDGLYGDNPPDGAANALQSQISRLRRVLGADASLVEFTPAGYRLAIDADEVDAHRFEWLAAEGGRALTSGDHARAAKLLDEALSLWRGPALADLVDAPFAQAQAQAARLEELKLAATEDHIEARLGLGEHRELVPKLQELVSAHPLRERLRAQLMRALAAAGRQTEALTVFEEARRTLAEELGADPSAELAAAHLAVLQGEQPAEQPRRTLPAQLTSFIGRDAELDHVGGLLARQRLVTLTGPGGTGKTRLSIEAASRVAHHVCFVELAPLTEITDVPQTVLAALGVRDAALTHPGQAGRPTTPVDRLITALTERPVLLVLDNCEHLIEAAARLAARLLAACPRLRILATSREPLGITGETLYPVPRLALPEPGTELARALGFPAVRLFADRASAVRADFAVDTGTLGDVQRICDALDGLPLAIELAAARVRTLTVADIAARLGDRFGLLSMGSRTAEARHRTLRGVVEWSWGLLDAGEQELARRLTVFAGGATLEAGAAVCGVSDIVDLMTGLADKSLVEVNRDRYRMLETIRVFCAERLTESGETEQMRRAHAEYFLALAEAADPHLRAAEQLDWLARLDAEYDNLHTALRWAIDSDVTLALKLMSALSGYWWLRGKRLDGAIPARELAEKIGTEPLDGLAEEHLICLLNAAYGSESPPARLAWNSIVDMVNRPPRQPFVFVLWAVTFGPPPTADDFLDRQAQTIGPDPWSQALGLMGMALMGQFRGNLTEAEHGLTAALNQFRALGERWGLANTLSGLGQLATWQGEHAKAVALIEEATDLVRQLGATEDAADLLAQRAQLRLRSGDPAGARADWEHSVGLARQAGSPAKVASAHVGLGGLARLSGNLDEARARYEEALEECPAGGFEPDEVRAAAHLGLGRVAEAEGDFAIAASAHRRELRAAVSREHLETAAVAVEALAGVALGSGDPEQAARLLGAGAMLRGTSVAADPDVMRVTAGARSRIGDEAFELAYQEGLAMTKDDMLRLS